MPFCGSIGFIRFFIDMLLAVLMPILMAHPCVLLRMVSFASPTHLPVMVVMSRTTSSIDVKLLLAIDAMVRPFQLRLAMMRSVLEISRPFFACPQQPIEQFIAIERFNRIVFFYYHQWCRFNNLIGRKPFSTAHTLSAPADFFILIRRS